MKLKATKKEMINGYFKVLGIGYCTMQYLLQYQTPIAYSASINGWSCDYYNIDNILISTGYSPISSKNMISDYDTIYKFEIEAQKIIYSDMDYKTKKQIVNQYLYELLELLLIK